MNKTRIEYLDFTWNYVVGCSGVGCAVRDKCWARAMGKRQKHRCVLCYVFVPHPHEERLYQPLKRNKPSRIGVSFSGDLFDVAVKPEWRAKAFKVMESAYWHSFICLTKQPQNAIEALPNSPLQNFWLGTSVNTKSDLWRIERLKETNAIVKAVSFEPLLSHVKPNLDNIDWVIIGAQTRPNKQPELWWVEQIFNEAFYKNIPIFLKDNLGCKEFFGSLEEFPR